MNRKKSSLCYLFLAFLLGGVFVLTSCDKGNDVYNPNHIQEEAKKAFPVKNIDPNQTWEMSSICNASVSVNEKTGGAYTIKVYTENPYNTNGNAFLLAKTSVTDGQTVNFKFDIPAALQYVYVMKVNSEGYSSAKSTLVTNGKIEVTFGGMNSVANATKTRAVSSIVSFKAPNLTDPTIFPTEKDISTYPNYPTDNIWTNIKNNYIVTSEYNAIDYQGNGGGIYIKGNVTLKSLYLGPNCKLFILPKSSLTLTSSGYSLGQSESMISIGTGATLTVAKGTLQASNATIYNAGTINANEIDIAGSGYIYSSGVLTVTDKVNISNQGSILVNEGTMSADELETAGSSSFYNSGNVTISDKTSLSSNNQKWENQGIFITDEMEIKASSSQLLTACKLYIKDEFKIDTSNDLNNSFNLEGGAYVECGSLFMDNAVVKMGGNSFFNVLGTAEYNYNLGGFYSITENYALLKIGKAVQKKAGNGNTIGYHGKLYVACNDHFENGLSGSVPYIIMEGDAQITGVSNTDIKIPESNCNPGYNSTPDGGGTDKVQNYAYAFEDMTKEVGDYDFNDVVLYVTSPMNGKIKATLKAAGATKQLVVRFRNKKTGEDKIVYDDVHAALGVTPGTITNTGSATGKAADVKTFEVGNDFSITEDGDFYIVNKEDKGEIHISEFTIGLKAPFVPYAIRIACANWKWPKERTQIIEAYTKFTNWAQDITSNLDWYSDPESIVNENVIGID